MKIVILCQECFRKGKPPSSNGIRELEASELIHFFPVEINDNHIYNFTCPEGHEFTAYFQEQRFEILFTVGIYAIIDGYYREAVASFNASLERFYEFYLTVVAIEHGVEKSVFDRAWKDVENQSERQLGAFALMYLIKNGRRAPLLSPNSEVKFRNRVIHKGTIPTREEAINFGNKVLEIISPTLKEMKEQFASSMREATSRHLANATSRTKRKGTPMFGEGLLPNPISVAVASTEPHETNLEDILKSAQWFYNFVKAIEFKRIIESREAEQQQGEIS